MAKVRVYVYVDEMTSSGASYKVFPPVVILGRGDKLEVVNTVEGFDALVDRSCWRVRGRRNQEEAGAEER